MDATSTPYLNEHLATWCTMLVSFPFAFLVIRTVKETNYEAEKVVYVDTTKESAIEDGIRGENARKHSAEKVPNKTEVVESIADM